MIERPLRQVLVTGGTGVVGAGLIKMLLRKNIETVLLARPNTPRLANLPTSAILHIISCDAADYEYIDEKLTGYQFDAFFHILWERSSVFADKEENRNNFCIQYANAGYSLAAVELCHRLNCPLFVMTGSQAEYGPMDMPKREDMPQKPVNAYGFTKIYIKNMTRLMCAHYGIEHVWPILFSVYGPGDKESLVKNTLESLRRGEDMPYTSGEQQWDFLYTLDAAEAIIALARQGKSGEDYNVAYGKSQPLKYYITEMYRLLAPTKIPLLGKIPAPVGGFAGVSADITKLQMTTGFSPRYDFLEGIRDILCCDYGMMI